MLAVQFYAQSRKLTDSNQTESSHTSEHLCIPPEIRRNKNMFLATKQYKELCYVDDKIRENVVTFPVTT